MIAAPTEKKRYPRADAIAVVRELLPHLRPVCLPERVIVAGSLRRLKPTVGDIELLYIPEMKQIPSGDFFSRPITTPATDMILERLIESRVIARRLNTAGHATWGPKNKLAVHLASGIPIDFFAATETNWYNYLVCRTGGAENNRAIATAAQARAWKWNPYDAGFTPVLSDGETRDPDREPYVVTSERAVFDFLSLPYREPHERL